CSTCLPLPECRPRLPSCPWEPLPHECPSPHSREAPQRSLSLTSRCPLVLGRCSAVTEPCQPEEINPLCFPPRASWCVLGQSSVPSPAVRSHEGSLPLYHTPQHSTWTG
ncbi:unnamed protein product, partial [Ectocarpus sp. 12 AP-2014]